MYDVIHGLLFGGGIGAVIAVLGLLMHFCIIRYGEVVAFVFFAIVSGALIGALFGAA